MKRLFFMLVVLFTLYLMIQIGFNYFSKGSINTYEIEKGKITFKVNETSNFKEGHNYLYNIDVNGKVFSFQIFHNFNKKLQVIKDIEYFKNNEYECILPIYQGDLVLSDVMCLNSTNLLTYYYNLKGTNVSLDNFVSSIEKYDANKFTQSYTSESIERINVYKQNLVKDHYIAINNYKGIYDISNNFNSVVYNISLFKNDVYNHEISMLTDRYYLVADYDSRYQFNKINVVDLVELETFTITSDKSISFDSYIQGEVDGMVYLYDKDHRIQYEINIEKKSIVQYSSTEIKYYKDGSWTTMTISEANRGLKFTDSAKDYESNQYVRIDKVGKEAGYYYLYKSNGSNYDVYRINIQDKKGLTYLFNTNSIDAISYVDNYVYFVNKNKVQVFKDDFGVKILVQYNELEFNKNIKFNVYAK